MMLARASASGLLILPAIAAAQYDPAGDSARAGYAWAWILAAVAIVVALAALFVRGNRRGAQRQ
jgi:hypothetical protein